MIMIMVLCVIDWEVSLSNGLLNSCLCGSDHCRGFGELKS